MPIMTQQYLTAVYIICTGLGNRGGKCPPCPPQFHRLCTHTRTHTHSRHAHELTHMTHTARTHIWHTHTLTCTHIHVQVAHTHMVHTCTHTQRWHTHTCTHTHQCTHTCDRCPSPHTSYAGKASVEARDAS